MRFENEMQSIAYDLEAIKGYNVLQGITISSEVLSHLEKAHYRKIDISDGIYVVNIGGYIGESVKAEIQYAKENGKEIIYHCD